MTDHIVVSHPEWLAARKQLLAKEKEFSRMRDELSRQRRELPWEKVEKDYVFIGPDGEERLAELFEGCSQLIVYHFMFGPDWSEGCKSCSFLADHYNPILVHLNQRDAPLVTVSRASLTALDAFKLRMGWNFKWVLSLDNDFNFDYQVSFTQDQLDSGTVDYNYAKTSFPSSEGLGISVFYKDPEGTIFHAYSCFARGLDLFLGVYNLLDIVPKGRDEAEFSYPMEWIRHHDRYGV